MPDTAYFLPTIYAATGVKVSKLGDLPACVGVLKSLINTLLNHIANQKGHNTLALVILDHIHYIGGIISLAQPIRAALIFGNVTPGDLPGLLTYTSPLRMISPSNAEANATGMGSSLTLILILRSSKDFFTVKA